MSAYIIVRIILKGIATACIATVMALLAIVMAIVGMMRREY